MKLFMHMNEIEGLLCCHYSKKVCDTRSSDNIPAIKSKVNPKKTHFLMLYWENVLSFLND